MRFTYFRSEPRRRHARSPRSSASRVVSAPSARRGPVRNRMSALYDRIGTTYSATRSEDPRIARAIHDALGEARTVLNVGAGSGSHEPHDREVIALDPSAVMIAQRPPGAA